jgi:hypothetical protein
MRLILPNVLTDDELLTRLYGVRGVCSNFLRYIITSSEKERKWKALYKPVVCTPPAHNVIRCHFLTEDPVVSDACLTSEHHLPWMVSFTLQYAQACGIWL